MKIQLPNNWKPRDYQMAAWKYLEGGGKHSELIWHRRAGKDELFLNWAAVAAFQRVAGYWHMLPEYSQARKAIWDAVNPHTGKRRIDEAFPKEIRKATRNDSMIIEFKNGSSWQVVGSDRYDSLVGSSPAGIVYSEWALANPSARAYLRPIMAENNGWQAFVTSARGRNHAYETYKAALKDPNAFAQILSAKDTGIFSDERLAEELRSYINDFGEEYGRSKFEQEYLCSFDAANIGAILAGSLATAEREGRINDVAYDPEGAPIEISADIGRRDSSTWWFWQPKMGGYSIIDYDGGWGLDADAWVERLQARIGKRKLGKIWLPHDARAKTFAAKHSAVEIFIKAFGTKHVSITPNSKKSDRVNAARTLIKRIEFNETTCEKGLEGLRAWSYEYNEETKTFSQEPKHDWACFVAGTMVKAPSGSIAIESIKKGDLVCTPAGNRHVTATHSYIATKQIEVKTYDGRKVICTANHKLFTVRGLVVADELRFGDILFTGKELSWRVIALILRVFGTIGIHQAITDSTQPRVVNFVIRNLLRAGGVEASTAGQIVRLKQLEREEKVYDLTVDQEHCYVANGILSSNSHDGDGFSYGCLIMQQTKPLPTIPKMKTIHGVTLNELWEAEERYKKYGSYI